MQIKQQYVAWLGDCQVRNNAVPTWSRPMVNGVNYPDEVQYSSNCWYPRARPIKHWRKQLQPRSDTGNSRRAGVGIPDSTPGGKVTLSNGFDKCCQNAYAIGEYVKKKGDGRGGCDNCCNVPKIVRSANTNLDKHYYTDSRAYLKDRTKTFLQNQSGSLKDDITYVSNEGGVWPKIAWPDVERRERHWERRKKLNIGYLGKCRQLIYKPNNTEFFTQGAVDSSSRIDRLRLKTIMRNSKSMEKKFGKSGANAASYKGTYNAPYFIKSRNQNTCVRTHVNGNLFNCHKN